MDSATTVLRTRCCLEVDTAAATLSGFAEVTVSVAEGQSNVLLNAHGLKITAINLGEASLAWGYTDPTLVPLPEIWKQNTVKDASVQLAQQCFLQYKHLRECCVRPNLCIKLPMVITATSSKELTLKIVYSVDQPTGFRFVDGYGFTRTDALDGVASWLPCSQTRAKDTSLDLEISVLPSQIVVSSGTLADKSPHPSGRLTTFHYKVSRLACLSKLFLCVGRFDVLSVPVHRSSKPRSSVFLSCFGPIGSKDAMEYTLKFFPAVYQFVEDYMQVPYPFESLKILFLPDIHPAAAGWHECITLSPTLLIPNKRTIDYGLRHRLQIALGLARVWFGAVIHPKSEADRWMTEGLAGWLQRRIIARLVGSNELRFCESREHRRLCDADDGSLPPLYPRNGVAELMGTEWFHRRELFYWKSTAVICMIEQRASHEAFKRVIERLVRSAAQSIRTGFTSKERLIAMRSFLKEVGQAGGIKKEIQAFAERWIYGRGCPTITTEVGFESKSYTLLLSMKQEFSQPCHESTMRAVKMSKDGSIGLVQLSVAESTGIGTYTVQLGADTQREARFKLHGRPRKRRRNETTISVAEIHAPVKWVRVNSDYAQLANIQTKLTEEMWSAMLEESVDIVAQSEAIHGLLLQDCGSLNICKTLEQFIRASTYSSVRMEAVVALATLSGREYLHEGLSFILEFYRRRRFDPQTGLPKSNAFLDLSELLVDQTVPVALGRMRDADGYTPKEAVELILKVLEYNNNEGNDFDDAEWISAWLYGLQEVVAEGEEEWMSIFNVIERQLARDALFPSRQQIVTQACLAAMGNVTLHQSIAFKRRMLEAFAKFVDPDKYEPKTRAVAAHVVTKISASIYGPDTAVFNTLSWLMEESSVVVREMLFHKMIDLISLLGAKARGKDGIQWRTVSLLYNGMIDGSKEGYFRYYCLLLLLTIADEPLSLYREPDDWILKTEIEKSPEAESIPVETNTAAAVEVAAATEA